MATKSIRITPAGAGKTNEMKRNIYKDGDHPRRCGENIYSENGNSANQGSPPQVRGKRAMRVRCAVLSRITPAGAGKTGAANCKPPIARDHPRRCGENQYANKPHKWGLGSPPQVRGKLARKIEGYARSRITPAGAGKTPMRGLHFAHLRDHPRRCGENNSISPQARRCTGSPPQVRGKPGNVPITAGGSRITPAGAGKTPTAKAVYDAIQDHPRRCGENLNIF